jgi:hypothetical protein
MYPPDENVVTGKRLGRRVSHDPRSRQFRYRPKTTTLVSAKHESHIGILDQGDLGSCTGNATVGALGCTPYYETLKPLLDDGLKLDEDEAVKIYSKATTIDEFDGSYPPDDTGSSGLAVAKAAKSFGLISAYRHAFGVEDTLAALCDLPVIIGIAWRTGCDSPDASGHIKYTGSIRGGHEICLDEIDVLNKRVWFRNSWGAAWAKNGRANMSFDDLDKALSNQGDATVFTALAEPDLSPDERLWLATREWANAPHSRASNVAAAKAIREWGESKHYS